MAAPHPAEALRGAHGKHLAGRRVALGVDAARGAPGAVRVARALLRLGADVQPLVSPGTAAWLPPDALEYATGRAPLTWPGHDRYDAVLLAPVGPGLARKLAMGLADAAPAAAALAHLGRAPVLAAPAEGVEPGPLEERGLKVVPGAWDPHGEPRPEALAARVAGELARGPLRGRAALVVAGGAFEPVDAMRVLATRGDPALARALRLELERRGARARLLLGPWGHPRAREERAFEGTRDLVLMAALLGPQDVLLLEEALPGHAPTRHEGKLPSGRQGLALELRREEHAVQALRGAARAVVGYRAGPGPAGEQAAALADRAEEALR